MPLVTVLDRSAESGLPKASTHCPTRSASESPNDERGEVVAVHLEHGEVRERVGPDHLGLELAPVEQDHAELVGVLDRRGCW